MTAARTMFEKIWEAHVVCADEGKPARSDVTASQIWDAISDGGGIGEWLWEYLREDADKVAKLAGEMAAAQAERAAEGASVDA